MAGLTVVLMAGGCTMDSSLLDGSSKRKSDGSTPRAGQPAALVTTTPPSRCEAGIQPCVDVATLPPTWTVTDGTIRWVSLRGDIDGDGRMDAEVALNDENDETEYLVVLGPLDRSITLPQDANASSTTWLPFGSLPGDATGDGLPDFRMEG